MARIEKTVFISYRRKDISWALAVYQYLTGQKYDVFFDFSSLSSGDFEEVIVSNIRARAHFVLILTPTALDRCNEPGDWLRREIETAIDDKRNIIPLFFDGFSFGSSSASEKLTGKLSAIKRYNGLDIPSGYFMEAMERLRVRYLNVPLNAVIHPVSTEVRKVVKEEQVAADKALERQREDIKEIVKPVEEKSAKPKQAQVKETTESPSPILMRTREVIWKSNFRYYGIGVGIVLLAVLGIVGVNSLIQYKVMVYVPAGEFTMGSDNDSADEKPVHKVTLDAYWIDKTEVTNAMYSNCVKDGECKEPSNTDNYFDPNYARHPVVYVSWDDASNYCSWVDRRLPTEAEWEKAASWDEENLTKNVFPWGDGIDCSFANYLDGGKYCVGTTSAVGSYPSGASPYGALDMAGNVWEWVNDWYASDYYATLGDNASNPQGPSNGDSRVLRGGSWYVIDYDARSARRSTADPSYADKLVGFRCARSTAP